MARKGYIGIDNIARKIKKGYIGIDNIARRIQKTYIGIGGVARPCFSRGELVCYGAITPLNERKRALAATTVGDYALFGGGFMYYDTVNSKTGTVDAYDKSLIKITVPELVIPRYLLAATTVGDYAIFGGGFIGNASSVSAVDVYDKALTRMNASSITYYLDGAGHKLAATTVGDYALFGGGATMVESSSYPGSYHEYGVNFVTAFDKSLTKHDMTYNKFDQRRHSLAATTVGDYALFGGGEYYYSVSDLASLEVYDKSLTKCTSTSIGQLKEGRLELAATSVGDYALFGGGFVDGRYYVSTVDVYDKSLTKTPELELSVARRWLSTTSVGDYALFGGGLHNSNGSSAVDAYDKSLIRTTVTGLSLARAQGAATTLGDYALFGGGEQSAGWLTHSTVDAYAAY